MNGGAAGIMAEMRLTYKHRERYHRVMKRHQGQAVGFQIDQIILPDGRKRNREFLTHPGAVGVLAFPTPNQILLVKQYRYPVQKFTYEIPAGKLAKGENPSSCVRRELEEEAGYRAKRVKKVLHFWPTAAFSDEVIHLYIATDLVKTEVHPDDDEFLEIVHVTPRQMEQLIRKGQIHDSKTLIAYMAWRTKIL